jgi:hypothetical protein
MTKRGREKLDEDEVVCIDSDSEEHAEQQQPPPPPRPPARRHSGAHKPGEAAALAAEARRDGSQASIEYTPEGAQPQGHHARGAPAAAVKSPRGNHHHAAPA